MPSSTSSSDESDYLSAALVLGDLAVSRRGGHAHSGALSPAVTAAR